MGRPLATRASAHSTSVTNARSESDRLRAAARSTRRVGRMKPAYPEATTTSGPIGAIKLRAAAIAAPVRPATNFARTRSLSLQPSPLCARSPVTSRDRASRGVLLRGASLASRAPTPDRGRLASTAAVIEVAASRARASRGVLLRGASLASRAPTPDRGRLASTAAVIEVAASTAPRTISGALPRSRDGSRSGRPPRGRALPV